MVMEPPWAVRIEDQAPLTIAAVVSGEAWITTAEGASSLLRAGTVGIVRGPEPYLFSDRPDTAPQIVVRPGQVCEDLAGRSMEAPLTRGVRTWGNDPDGRTVVIVGTYERIGELGRHVLAALPPLAELDRNAVGGAVVDLIAAEITRDQSGQGVVLDRLLDLLTVSALRSWFDGAGPAAPGWWQAGTDPVVGPALRLLQHNPAHRWTVSSLAAEVGVSRAVLARDFTELVGRPPIDYLTEWRLDLAADLLLDPDATVQGVAAQVGYSTGFALSAAFKRVRGISPTAYREQRFAA